jgi:hypothetical protein
LAPRQLVAHRNRAEHDARHPAHVTIRLASPRSLRNAKVWASVRGVLRALHTVRDDFRVTAFSLQYNHLHFIVEADSHKAFLSGVLALCIRIAKRTNRALGRKGRIFADRYHVTPLHSPRLVRNAYAYVLLNRAKHLHQLGRSSDASFDPFSSYDSFDGWKERAPRSTAPATAPPRTWLGARGWQRHGLISKREIPSARPGS